MRRARVYEAALALARVVDDRRAEWQALLDLGQLWGGRDYARADTYARQALALARAMDDPAILAHSLNWVGNWHANADQPFASQRYLREALAIFQELGDQGGILAVLPHTQHQSLEPAHGEIGVERARDCTRTVL